MATTVVTLKVRAEFQRVRGGGRASMPAFLLEGKPRAAPEDGIPVIIGPRFGFTITKKLGNAVVRNRMRRRLKAALAGLAATHAAPDMDYVVVARPPAFDQDFAALAVDLKSALRRVEAVRSGAHRSGRQSSGEIPRRPKR
ncbi:MAG: ribonuclease P protein component [Hyphomicrobiaceae bacterium]|nr:ribonuclease P protein component [Hyphomicrobiaceae bacterium]